jgi:hypothetical protein
MSGNNQYHFTDGHSVHVEDWQQFLLDNEYILTCLENLASHCNDITANVSTIFSTFSYNSFSSRFRDFPSEFKPTYGNEQVVSDLKNLIVEMSDYLAEKSSNFIVIQSNVERQLYQYSSQAGGLDLRGDLIDVGSDAVSGFFEKLVGFPGLGFLITYGANSLKDHIDIDHGFEPDDVADISENARDWLAKNVFLIPTGEDGEIEYLTWINRSLGSIVAGGLTLAKEIIEHEGEWEAEDVAEILLDSGIAGLNYAASSAVSAWCAAKVGSVIGCTLGGPIGYAVGAAAGAVASVVLSYAWEGIKNLLFGEEVVHEFTSGGNVYQVPGRRNDYTINTDDIITALEEKHQEYVGENYRASLTTGVYYSVEVYKNEMYNGTEFFCDECSPDGDNYAYNLNIYRGCFTRLFDPRNTNFTTREEFENYYNEVFNPNTHAIDGIWDSYDRRIVADFNYWHCETLGFDPWEYYNFLRTGSWECN